MTRGVDLIPDTVCKSRWCRQILSRLRADLRENPIKQWASRDALIQSAGSISDSARYHSDANIALGPILKMYIPGQIRIFNALNNDGYSTGNAPPSGNNLEYLLIKSIQKVWEILFSRGEKPLNPAQFATCPPSVFRHSRQANSALSGPKFRAGGPKFWTGPIICTGSKFCLVLNLSPAHLYCPFPAYECDFCGTFVKDSLRQYLENSLPGKHPGVICTREQ